MPDTFEIMEPFRVAQIVSQYKVTLPIQLRKEMKLKIGDYLKFTWDGDQIFAEKLK